MSTVFLSGSRRISQLNDMVRNRLQNIVHRNLQVVVGDASGADKAMQSYLSEQGYTNVLVFCVGGSCRNNVRPWPFESVATDPNLKGRALYTQRDEAMAERADFGFVLWDGHSQGSLNNVLELLKRGKRAVVYFAPRKQFVNIRTAADVQRLLQRCEAKSSRSFRDSMHLRHQMESLLIGKQAGLGFPN